MTAQIKTGRFVWFEMVTPDVDRARGFYGELFPWGTQSLPVADGGYPMITLAGEGQGGYVHGTDAAHWLAHLQVADARATSRLIRELGGRVEHEAVMEGFGTKVVARDPSGARFALWQPHAPNDSDGSGDYRDAPGAFCWAELYAPDAEQAVAFYTRIGGFTHTPMTMPNGTYHVLTADGVERAGVMTPPMPLPPQWQPYVQVTDVDATAARAKQLGATIHMVDDVPGVGRLGIIGDPQGARIGILKPARG